MELFDSCKKILKQLYIGDQNSYLAGGILLRELSKYAESCEIKSGKTTARFLVCGNHVLYTKTVAYHRKYQIAHNRFDVMKNCTTVKASKIHIRAFFNKDEYRKCTLAINIGNLQHDMAVFIRKEASGTYHFIHYDPNQGVTSQITTKFVHQFGSKITRHGYHDKNGNQQGNCTELSWTEILQFMLKHENPFDRVDLKRFCSVTKTYLSTSEYKRVMARVKEQSRVYESTKRLK